MHYKNLILMLLIKKFEARICFNTKSKEVAVEEAIAECLILVSNKGWDKEWYADISQSFHSTIIHGKNVDDWLADQLKKLGIFQASNEFQGKKTSEYHCMDFVFDFFHHKKERSTICNVWGLFHDRAISYLEQYRCSSISKENLNPGNLILYMDPRVDKYKHIAIFVTKINSIPYAISRFGMRHNVFIHPVNFSSENHGIPIYFKNNEKLTTDVITKLENIKTELYMHLSSFSLAQPPSPVAKNAAIFSTKEEVKNSTSSNITHLKDFESESKNITGKIAGEKAAKMVEAKLINVTQKLENHPFFKSFSDEKPDIKKESLATGIRKK